MAQATPLCPHSAGLCRVRVTALDADGTVASGPNNSYVTDSPIHLSVTPEVKAGTSSEVVNGCGCVCVTRRTQDRLLRFDLELQLCAIEPALMSMLLGATVIEDDSDIPVPKGIWWPNQGDCTNPTSVAVEAWSEAWEDDSQAASPNKYVYWLFPQAFFQVSNFDLADGFMLPVVSGVTRANPAWLAGPYGDVDAGSAEPLGGVFWTDLIPDADCAFSTVGSS